MVGAQLLKKHLRETGQGLREFGRKARVPASQVCRYMKREGEPGLTHAFAIDDATLGRVPARSWIGNRKDS